MPENCTIVKEMKCRSYGAKVLNKGHNLAEVGQVHTYGDLHVYTQFEENLPGVSINYNLN